MDISATLTCMSDSFPLFILRRGGLHTSTSEVPGLRIQIHLVIVSESYMHSMGE